MARIMFVFITVALACSLLSGSNLVWAQYDMRNSNNPYMGMDLRTKMALEERDKRVAEQNARQKAGGGATKQKGQIQVQQPIKQQPKGQQPVKPQTPKPQAAKPQPQKQQTRGNQR